MSRPDDQTRWPDPARRPAPARRRTKDRILQAAAELIAERGWGGVTTRAVADRAGVLNGVVSYHFDGKADLLRQAALAAVVQTIGEPVARLLAAPHIPDGIRAVAAWLAEGEANFPDLAVMAETMLGAQRDPELQQLLAAIIEDFRAAVAAKLPLDTTTARAEAAIVAAVLDGVILHRLVDPQFDPVPALQLLADLVEQAGASTAAPRRSEP